ncbi:antiactivator of flagellar biosynthesis FleN protein [Noviherbaspirillum sp. CPCC 100848]|uniref:Antiactivator of flagellar biosynthesis FleN protein n=1 Tax=Noviherbaspirillum album TaxID=3080276 RepID=A0ABU6JCL4_9BURK|nr:antiactivator of flagellar biosynthesis FleN protein [Noviherbaspirillum sp. CPCC 100848]MEC4721382.1 antiactivator of flagellar biosynthesis FleN protein [Noviherbaspirillum sp. CPCC 100848]
MASFDFDQAEGLRRMLAGPKPRVFTFLSAASPDEKGAMLVNLGASLAQAGRDVLLLDACVGADGIASRLKAVRGSSLLQASQHDRAFDELMQPMPQGFSVAALKRGAQKLPESGTEGARRLDDAFGVLTARADIVVVDAELDGNDAFAIPALAETEIVVQVSNSPASIKAAYTLIKRVNGQLGRRPFSLLVTGASDKEAQLVYQNMAQAANRYLAVKLNSMGSVPPDEHLKKAMHLGRAVVDAFPLAGASVAFRRLAGKFVLSDAAAAR